MKNFLQIIACISLFVLTGCITVCETCSPALTAKFSTEAKLNLEGFQLQSIRATQHHIGYASASAYNYRTNSWTSGSGSYSGTTYERVPDGHFASIVRDMFESSGANVRTQNPELTIEGRIGDGHFIWSSPAMWYRDAPVFLFAICTFGMAISCERENDVRLLVYGNDGKRIKEYYASASYHAAGIGLPFALFANEKMYEWYGDRMAAKFALIKCMNDFIKDYNSGFYHK